MILNKGDYLAKANRQLSDFASYRLLPDNSSIPTTKPSSPSFRTLALSIVFLPKTSVSSISSIPALYLLPKIHKPNNLGHPIISSHHSFICRLPYLTLFPIPTFLHQRYEPYHHHPLLFPLPTNTLLATVNIISFYNNIPYTHGLSALEKFLSRHPPTSHPSTPFLLSLTTSSSPITTSLLICSINFRLRAQPWEPGWPPPC